jgi:hypothetical protein
MQTIDWNNKEVVLKAVNQRGNALQFASKELQTDREVVLAAVSKTGWALRFASKELHANKEVVLAAVNQCGVALYYASEELQADKEVVLAAVKQHCDALYFASEDLKADPEIIAASKGIKYEQNGNATLLYGCYFVSDGVSGAKEKELIDNNYEVRATTLTIYPKSESILSELATTLTIVNNGGGEYLEVGQKNLPNFGKIEIYQQGWPALKAAIDRMIADCRE